MLIANEVKIFLVMHDVKKGKGNLHTKAIFVDSFLFGLGSANFTDASFTLNEELWHLQGFTKRMADYIYKSYFNYYERNGIPFDLAAADELEAKHVARTADKLPVVEANPDTLVLAESSRVAAPQAGARSEVVAESPVPFRQRTTIHSEIQKNGKKRKDTR